MKFAIKVVLQANEVQRTEKEAGIKETCNAAYERVVVLHGYDFEKVQKFFSDIDQLIDTHDQFKEVQ
jgi:hypothetical protein